MQILHKNGDDFTSLVIALLKNKITSEEFNKEIDKRNEKSKNKNTN